MRQKKAWFWFGYEALVLVGIIAVWWFLVAVVVPATLPQQAFVFPTPDVIFEQLVENFLSGASVQAVGATLWRYFIGLAIGSALGVGLGLLLGINRIARIAAEPFTSFMRSMPGVALIPMLTLFLGLGDEQKIALIVLVIVWPICLNTMDGVLSVEATLQDTAKSYRISGFDRLRLVILPAASPQIFVGLRLAVAIALSVVITSELIGASSGLGFYLYEAKSNFEMGSLWAGILVVGLLGCLLTLAFLALERRVLAWHRGARDANVS